MTNLFAAAIAFFAIWLVSLKLRDASIVDMFWGLGFVLIAWLTLVNTNGLHLRALTIAAMVSVWGVRLSAYLTWRNWGKPEDHRYASMRESRGKSFAWVSLYMVFGLQGLLMWIISLPIQVGIAESRGWHWLVVPGIGLFAIGLLFEAVGDFQLARFKANPANKGRVMDRGLWAYTRHPNYFGDFMVWWGFYLVAIDAQSWWWTIIGPAIMSFFLIRVSGVPMLESAMMARVSGYEEYVQKTSAFFPWPPKQADSSAERTL